MEGRIMKTATKKNAMSDAYLAMIRRFPLRPIRNEAEYEEASGILDKNFPCDNMDRGKEDYILVLAGLVADYEERRHSVDVSDVTPLAMLKHLMEANDMNTADLGRLLGNSGLASLIIHGKRAISKSNARILGKRFGLNAGVFI
jgi:HTH-type transcriptional regulator / antitoxin HigA